MHVISHGNLMDLIETNVHTCRTMMPKLNSEKGEKVVLTRYRLGCCDALRSSVSFAEADIWPYLSVTPSKAFQYSHRRFYIL